MDDEGTTTSLNNTEKVESIISTNLFARAEDQDEESDFMAGVPHIGRMLEADDADVTSRQRR